MNGAKVDMRCDNCGKQVYDKDLSKGATCDLIGHGISGEVWEVICAPCNMKFEQERAA